MRLSLPAKSDQNPVSRLKVLLLSPFFYPETISTGKYNTVLTQALARAGADVTVIASHPFYPGWKPVRSEAGVEGISVLRGGAWVRYPSIVILRRLVFEVWYSLYVWWTVCTRCRTPDIVIAVFPPVLFFALMPLFRNACRNVGIVHDFQGKLGLRGKRFLSKAVRSIVRKAEAKAFQRCQMLIVLSQSMAEVANGEYGVDRKRIRVAYPFVTLDRANKPGKNLVHLFAPEFQHVVYSGALGKKQNPLLLFQLFRAAAQKTHNVHFHIFSEGPLFEEILRLHEKEPVPGLTLQGLVPEPDLPELYARSTVQVIPQAEGTSDACLPSKLPNILAAGCALFAICDEQSELSDIVRTCLGKVVSSWDLAVLVTHLSEFLSQSNAVTRSARQTAVVRLLEEQFSLDALVRAVLNQADDVGLNSATVSDDQTPAVSPCRNNAT